MSRNLALAVLLLAVLPLQRSYGTIFHDEFTTSWNYGASGTVPPGGIWTGVYNPNAGGTAMQSNSFLANNLTIGMSGVGWENGNDTGPMLYKEVNAADFVRVTAKITSQTQGNWSLAGVYVRQSNPIDNVAGQENWYGATSFRTAAAPNFQFQSNRVLMGAEAELDTTVAAAGDLAYMRIESVPGSPGRFAAFRSADGTTWIPHPSNGLVVENTNANLANGTIQIGVGGGAIGTLANSRTQFDWVDIETVTAAVCSTCTWNFNGAGNWNFATNWNNTGTAPNSNTVTAAFGSVLTGPRATVYTDSNVSVKELQFNNATSKYILAGPGQITLDSDTSTALINVLSGTHEIQTHLALADDVTATASNGATLNINTTVQLNGHTLSTAGAGTIALNNGSVGGAGSGSGSLVNGASLVGLSSLEGDLTQTADGSLSVSVGSAAINVSGSAVLDGVLNVSLADGFTPVVGQSYTVLTADSVTNAGLSLGGDAGGLFRLAVGGDSVSLTAVPEPSTIAIVGLGLIAAMLGRRRRAERLI